MRPAARSIAAGIALMAAGAATIGVSYVLYEQRLETASACTPFPCPQLSPFQDQPGFWFGALALLVGLALVLAGVGRWRSERSPPPGEDADPTGR